MYWKCKVCLSFQQCHQRLLNVSQQICHLSTLALYVICLPMRIKSRIQEPLLFFVCSKYFLSLLKDLNLWYNTNVKSQKCFNKSNLGCIIIIYSFKNVIMCSKQIFYLPCISIPMKSRNIYKYNLSSGQQKSYTLKDLIKRQ